MSQCFIPISLDKMQKLTLGPLEESSDTLVGYCFDNYFYMNKIEKLLSEDGPWYKTSIIWAGEYTPTSKYMDDFQLISKHLGGTNNIYTIAIRAFKDALDMVNDEMHIVRYLFNDTKKEYVDLDLCDNDHAWLHPLPLLTVSCDLSSEDIKPEYLNEYVGSWCGDSIFATLERPESMHEYKEIIPNFMID